MPIITPSYPQQNSTFNVTLSTRNIIMHEFKIAKEICDQILLNKLEWNELFKSLNFFGKYTHFIAVICSDQAEWVGLLESKIRILGMCVFVCFRLSLFLAKTKILFISILSFHS